MSPILPAKPSGACAEDVGNSVANEQAQSLAVKRAEVEFHNFASLGEPERASRVYREENIRRGAILRSMGEFLGPLTPFAEIGANAGHTSLMLMTEFGAEGFATDISADSLRHGYALMREWGVERSPVRIAADALNLPFADESLQCVLACQMLSQFMDIEAVFVEAKRVLAPGGVFIFSEEPLRRLLTLRLWRCPYVEQMTPWEKRLNDWGVLPFLVRDVIGAEQEESFGIRQNHSMGLAHWHALVSKHFASHEYRMFVPERGPLERIAKRIAIRLDPHGSEWRAARLLGGTLSAACRKAGTPVVRTMPEQFEDLLRCPDCHGRLRRDERDTLTCTSCTYAAANEGGVYNLIESRERAELYPGDREDVIDCSLTGHEARLGEGWYELEGVYGNKYRWIAPRATFRLRNVRGGEQVLRIRGFRPPGEHTVRIDLTANGAKAGNFAVERPGLFVIEASVAAAEDYQFQLAVSPDHQPPGEARRLSVTIGRVQLLSPARHDS